MNIEISKSRRENVNTGGDNGRVWKMNMSRGDAFILTASILPDKEKGNKFHLLKSE